MKVIAHKAPGIYLQTLVLLAVIQRINNNLTMVLSCKNIYPTYSCKCHKIGLVWVWLYTVLTLKARYDTTCYHAFRMRGCTNSKSVSKRMLKQGTRLIAQLDEDDRKTVLSIIDKMLTNKKFKTFFKENVR